MTRLCAEPGQVQPKPTTVRADATYATGDELIHAIEDEFWRVVETSPYEVQVRLVCGLACCVRNSRLLQVEYGSDIPSSAHISGFDHTKMDPKADYNAQKEFLAFKRKQGSETIPVDFSSREYYQNCGCDCHMLCGLYQLSQNHLYPRQVERTQLAVRKRLCSETLARPNQRRQRPLVVHGNALCRVCLACRGRLSLLCKLHAFRSPQDLVSSCPSKCASHSSFCAWFMALGMGSHAPVLLPLSAP